MISRESPRDEKERIHINSYIKHLMSQFLNILINFIRSFAFPAAFACVGISGRNLSTLFVHTLLMRALKN